MSRNTFQYSLYTRGKNGLWKFMSLSHYLKTMSNRERERGDGGGTISTLHTYGLDMKCLPKDSCIEGLLPDSGSAQRLLGSAKRSRVFTLRVT